MTEMTNEVRIAGIRATETLKEAAKLSAFSNRRSMNSEVAIRLEDSLKEDGWIDKAEKSLAEGRAAV